MSIKETKENEYGLIESDRIIRGIKEYFNVRVGVGTRPVNVIVFSRLPVRGKQRDMAAVLDAKTGEIRSLQEGKIDLTIRDPKGFMGIGPLAPRTYLRSI